MLVKDSRSFNISELNFLGMVAWLEKGEGKWRHYDKLDIPFKTWSYEAIVVGAEFVCE